LRATPAIPRKIAAGKGKRSPDDRSRYFDFTRGSALECSAIQDVLLNSSDMAKETSDPMKAKLKRIVTMLSRRPLRSDHVSKSLASFDGKTVEDCGREDE